MRRKKTDRELLQEVEGIGPKRSENLISRFGDGREVERAATSAFGRLADTEGISEDTARDMFDRMGEAGVRDELKSRQRMGGEARGAIEPTDIGREPDGEYARPESAPDIEPAPIAREQRTGEFGLDPFDLTSSTAGVGVDTTFGGRNGGGALDGGGSSVPTRPYQSRNDGPPSQVGPYELTQDRQNDDFRTVAFENKESDRSVVFQTYNTDLDGPEATVDVTLGDNSETIAEGDADDVYGEFIAELEERRDKNKERNANDGSGLRGREAERLEAAQRLFGGE